MKIAPMIYGSLAVALAVAGCANKEEIKPDATPSPAATPQAATPEPTEQPTAAAPTAMLHYVVRKGDSLWLIASRQGMLGDPMQWPLLYRTNRDQIADPDLIDAGEELNYSVGADTQDVATAEQEAKDTPPYVQHTDVRKTLPVNY
ncbi:MAG TPA: LysM peptidoglycan-binding domain-containing protein [bacterium]|nr:LysM peptidoglycan-binding domain-containing protein [bacterium]